MENQFLMLFKNIIDFTLQNQETIKALGLLLVALINILAGLQTAFNKFLSARVKRKEIKAQEQKIKRREEAAKKLKQRTNQPQKKKKKKKRKKGR